MNAGQKLILVPRETQKRSTDKFSSPMEPYIKQQKFKEADVEKAFELFERVVVPRCKFRREVI